VKLRREFTIEGPDDNRALIDRDHPMADREFDQRNLRDAVGVIRTLDLLITNQLFNFRLFDVGLSSAIEQF
jgi:hypothetical protein